MHIMNSKASSAKLEFWNEFRQLVGKPSLLLKMNQPMSLKFKNYLRSSYDNILLLGGFNNFGISFSNKNMKDLYDMFELNHLIKTQHVSKAQTPYVLITFTLTKMQCFLIHLLSR